MKMKSRPRCRCVLQIFYPLGRLRSPRRAGMYFWHSSTTTIAPGWQILPRLKARLIQRNRDPIAQMRDAQADTRDAQALSCAVGACAPPRQRLTCPGRPLRNSIGISLSPYCASAPGALPAPPLSPQPPTTAASPPCQPTKTRAHSPPTLKHRPCYSRSAT